MFEFKDDRIFLLSIEEYKNYKDHIPQIYCWWWLRSPGSGPNFTAFVFIDDSVLHSGDLVSNDRGAIRPALYYDNISLEKEEKFIYCGITWVVLDRNLAIAEVPITFKRFDENDNNYETSEVRQFLLEWYMHRKNFKEVLWETE